MTLSKRHGGSEWARTSGTHPLHAAIYRDETPVLVFIGEQARASGS